MNTYEVTKWWMIASLASMAVGFHTNTIRAQPGDPADGQQGVEVLTRGPVHEAFAETVTFNPEPGIVAPKAPREIIEEVPPDLRPEGANVTWIPGYWAWDDERNDFLWISGIWRALPPGRQWVPGYWGQTSQGYQWTSGYWADARVSEVEYLPEPPESVEIGPNIAAPSPDQNWSPGCWVWHQNRYAWRPGYWEAGRPDWVWIPAHYIWAPRGYVYSDGYWDYSVERRGVLFAPVYFETVVYTRRDFHYSPSFAINLTVFSDSLFLRPRYQHYYFGDYYAAGYRTSGFDACFSLHSSRAYYDPIFAHARWEHRGDREWGRRVEVEFNHRRDHEYARPPRTLALQISLSAGKVKSDDKGLVVAASFDQMAKRKDGPMRFQPVAKVERQQFAQRGHEVQKSREERRKLDANVAAPPSGMSSKGSEPSKVRLPKSPIVGKPANELAKGQAPPKTHEAPKPDPKIEPKPRRLGDRPEATRGGPMPKKVDQRPEPPKARSDQPKPGSQPKAEPQKPAVQPKAEPAKQAPKTEPAKATPRPQPEPPKSAPKPRPEPPKPAPKSEPPKARPDQPKPVPQPKAQPQKPAEKPKAEPAKQAPKREPAKATPRPQPEPPKPAPKPTPQPPPRPGPKPDPPNKTESKEKPKEKH